MGRYSNNADFSEAELKYLDLLSLRFPTIIEASVEIINLEAIVNLPKGTEYFLTDLHGEHEAFGHVLRNASGTIREKVNEIFGNHLRESSLKELCALIYYPEQRLERVMREESDVEDWFRITINQLIEVLSNVSLKYTRSKVRKALPPDFAYIIDELLHEAKRSDRGDYFNNILSSIISIGCADKFIISICNVIQRMAIDRLHIVGDIYDRGAGPHHIMEQLREFNNFDIQWGNHDIAWMGAAAGNLALIACVLRMSLRYSNLEVLEDGYGINLLPLATFAMETYAADPCSRFIPKSNQPIPYSDKTIRLMAQMHKAISVIQFKLEGQLIEKRPEFEMEHRNVLKMTDFERGVFCDENGGEYALNDRFFPTIDPKDPCRLSEEEQEMMLKLCSSFKGSDMLNKHVKTLYSAGSVYLAINNNLLYHALVPMNEDGSLCEMTVGDEHRYKGRELLDKIDRVVRRAYFGHSSDKKSAFAHDYIWYMWCGPNSPLFGKNKMTTFERYFIDDKQTHQEIKNPYYGLIDDPEVCARILEDFGLDPEISHIINGHVPVRLNKGETPIKASGRLLVIDGGFSKAYQSETGIAGYTLMYNSHGLNLVHHEPFESMQKAIDEGIDIRSIGTVVEANSERIKVKDTDVGRELLQQIVELKRLIAAYRGGAIKEKTHL